MQSFYKILKATDEHLRFIFLTGVSKFSKVSIFSGLNNLNDITMDDKYAVTPDRLGAAAASTTVHAGYKRSISHCLFCGHAAAVAPNRQLAAAD